MSSRPQRLVKKLATHTQLYDKLLTQDESDYEEGGDDLQWTENRRDNRRKRFDDRSTLEATPPPLDELEGNKEIIDMYEDWACPRYKGKDDA